MKTRIYDITGHLLAEREASTGRSGLARPDLFLEWADMGYRVQVSGLEYGPSDGPPLRGAVVSDDGTEHG